MSISGAVNVERVERGKISQRRPAKAGRYKFNGDVNGKRAGEAPA
jgi:hypothetical protein